MSLLKPLGSSRHVSTRLDTFDVSSESRQACRAHCVKCVELVVSSVSSHAVRQANKAKMHGLDTSNMSSCVMSCRDVTSQVEFGLNTAGTNVPL